MLLQNRFKTLLSQWNLNETQIDSFWNSIQKNYNESFRQYHNLNHISELFEYFDSYKHYLKHPNEVALAIFYHDVIYNVWSKQNEWKSAELAKEHLHLCKVNTECISRIYKLILVTKNHCPETNVDETWFIDFDMAILGQPWDTYFQYTQNIRKEYATVPSFMYKKGRKKVLQHFLETSCIYHTKTFYERFEAQARHNITKELNLL